MCRFRTKFKACREQILKKHGTLPSCFVCYRKFNPLPMSKLCVRIVRTSTEYWRVGDIRFCQSAFYFSNFIPGRSATLQTTCKTIQRNSLFPFAVHKGQDSKEAITIRQHMTSSISLLSHKI